MTSQRWAQSIAGVWLIALGQGTSRAHRKSIQQGGRAVFGILQAAPPVALRRSEPSSQLDWERPIILEIPT